MGKSLKKIQTGGKTTVYDPKYLNAKLNNNFAIESEDPSRLALVAKNQGYTYVEGSYKSKNLVFEKDGKKYYYNEQIHPTDKSQNQYRLIEEFKKQPATLPKTSYPIFQQKDPTRSATDFQYTPYGITGYVDTTKPQGVNNPIYYLDSKGNPVNFNDPNFNFANYKSMAMGGSMDGYRHGSMDEHNPYNLILSGNISMDNVPQRLIGIDDLQDMRIMIPGMDEMFNGNMVMELPLGKKGGIPNNKGFKALPKHIQEKIISNMRDGGVHNIDISTATKVQNAPTDFNYLKDEGNKKYYTKEVAAPTAITGTMNTTNPEQHRQVIIKMLQSGIKPEDVISAGHASPQAMQNLSQYYVPKVVYTEQVPTTSTTTQKKLLDDTIKNRKIVSSPGNQVNYYTSYQLPDANGGYSQSSVYHFDNKTNRAIDSVKSFDDKGNYVPYYIYSDEKMGHRDDPTSYGIKTTNINQPIGTPGTTTTNTQSSGYSMGGDVDFMSLKKYLKNYAKKQLGGTSAPQNMNTNDYLTKRNDMFVKKLQGNLLNTMIDEEVAQAEHQYKMGGGYYAQVGKNIRVNLIDPSNPLYVPQPIQNNNLVLTTQPQYGGFGNIWAGYNGLGNNDVPKFVTDYLNTHSQNNTEANQNNTEANQNNTEANQNTPTMNGFTARQEYNNNRGITDPNLAAYTDEDLQALGYLPKKKKNNNLSKFIGIGMAGLEGFNALSANVQNAKNERMMRDRMRFDNVLQANTGSRGDYDVNSGSFRPNQMTPSQYQVGGQYEMSNEEIEQFMKMGGKVKIIG